MSCFKLRSELYGAHIDFFLIRHGVVTGKVMVGEVLEMQVSHVRPMRWGGVMWVLWVGMMCLSTGIAEAHGERELRPLQGDSPLVADGDSVWRQLGEGLVGRPRR